MIKSCGYLKFVGNMPSVKGQVFNQYILFFVAQFALFLQEKIFKDMLLYMIMMRAFICVIV